MLATQTLPLRNDSDRLVDSKVLDATKGRDDYHRATGGRPVQSALEPHEDSFTVYLSNLPAGPYRGVSLLVQGKLFFESRPRLEGEEVVTTTIELPPLMHDGVVELEVKIPARNIHRRMQVRLDQGSHLLVQWNPDTENKEVEGEQLHVSQQPVPFVM
ncbi:uncharacterized protein ACA1_313890 [Acanthamoeba castellanii str. Neff]|uniref:Uncharacterized protein n=1 Tax=Acanthamoeba castellanii (strain ATCC 30010 / Neff) TaxID=1257118 RepID=L8H1J9_ACACF|nr:uncharacterized protein ACA1_313890 [Acanthamoeba castellanii str. Neff]ELR18628.1 hypothetical protein ACA1_313890 [Acanthamoeba castellanii str. Neff]